MTRRVFVVDRLDWLAQAASRESAYDVLALRVQPPLRLGEQVVLRDGDGNEWPATCISAQEQSVRVGGRP